MYFLEGAAAAADPVGIGAAWAQLRDFFQSHVGLALLGAAALVFGGSARKREGGLWAALKIADFVVLSLLIWWAFAKLTYLVVAALPLSGGHVSVEHAFWYFLLLPVAVLVSWLFLWPSGDVDEPLPERPAGSPTAQPPQAENGRLTGEADPMVAAGVPEATDVAPPAAQ